MTATPSPLVGLSTPTQYDTELELYTNIEHPVTDFDAPAKLSALIQQVTGPEELNAGIHTTQHDTAPYTSNDFSLNPSLNCSGPTDDSIICQVVEYLRQSKSEFWLGCSHRIIDNCRWDSIKSTDRSTLRWKENAPDNVTGVSSAAIVSFIGQVAASGPFLNPDAGWRLHWGDNTLYKHQRAFCVVSPRGASGVPTSWWQAQWEGAGLIVENGRKLSNGRRGPLGYCFKDQAFKALRIRAPLFLRVSASSPDIGDNTPRCDRYSTWGAPCSETRDIIDRVIGQGSKPQPFDVRDRCDELVHPNDVLPKLDGAIVLISCTLERASVSNPRGNGRMKRPECQFYANLIELQVLKSPISSTSSTTTEQKLFHD